MQIRHGHKASIVATDVYLPPRSVPNKEIAHGDTTSDWIVTRTGIKSRHYAEKDDVVSMATKAARGALSLSGAALSDVGLTILCTSTSNRQIPGGAAAVASGAGLRSSGAFDLVAVCAGFTYGLAMAAQVADATQAHVLVVGSEKLSSLLNFEDGGTYPIFGDGAGAAVVAPSIHVGIGPAVWGSDGDRAELIRVNEDSQQIEMNGPLVFRWSTKNLPDQIRLAVQRAGVAVDDISHLVLHQANQRILDAIGSELGFSTENVASTIGWTGNTSAASIPIALDHLRSSGKASGLAILAGFGSGLTYCTQVIDLDQLNGDKTT